MLKTKIVSRLEWLDPEKNIANRDVVQKTYFLGILIRQASEDSKHDGNIRKPPASAGFKK